MVIPLVTAAPNEYVMLAAPRSPGEYGAGMRWAW